jgi:hypothetical protein
LCRSPKREPRRGYQGGVSATLIGPFSSSDVDDRDDPVVAINDDDLIADDEVHVPAPLGMNPDERRGNLHHPHAGGHRGAHADGEVDVIDSRYIPAGQDFFPNLRPLLRGQTGAATCLALLRLTLLCLSLLRSLAWLLTPLRRLTGLALLTLLALLTRGLLALLLPLARLLRLAFLALLTLLALWCLTRGLLALLLPLARLLGLTLFALLRARFALTLGRLACGLSFLAALRLALLLSFRGLLGLALLGRRLLLPLGGAAALLALHGLG